MTDRIVKVVLRGQVTDFVGGMRAASSAARATVSTMADGSKESVKYRQNLSALGTSAGKIGLVSAAGVGLAVRSFANFDQAMSNVAATGDDAKQNLDALRDAAIKFGASTQFSATESANAIEELVKAGVSAKDVLGGGLKGALDLAAAGGLEVADAASIAATAMVQFSLDGTKVPHIADLLAAAAGKAQGSVQDMGQALKYVGPVAAQMGISIEETTGVIAELANSGILADQAGTSLRGMLTSLTSPSKIAKKTMDELGISLYDTSGNFVGFDGVAGQLQDTLGGLSNAERDQALGRIFGNEQITAARILYKGGAADVDKWTKSVNDSGYAQEVAATKMDNLKGDLEQLKGAFETALIGTGEGANGPLRETVQSLTGLINAYNALPGPIKTAALAGLGLTAAIGGTAFVASRAISAYSGVRANIEQLGTSFEGANKKALALRGGALAAGIGLASLSTSAHGVDEDLGDLTDIASAAALGFSVGGPWGAAIGGGVGALSALSGQSDSAAASIAALTATLDQQTGAFTTNTASAVAKRLQDEGIADDLGKVGISLSTATDAALGNAEAMAQVADKSQRAGLEGDHARRFIDQLSGQLKDGAAKTRELSTVTGESTVAQGAAATAIDETGQAASDAGQQVQTYGDALKGLLDPLLSQDAAANAWKDSIASLTEDLKKNGTSISENTTKGRANQNAIRDRVSALKESIQADEAAGAGQDQMSAKLRRGAKNILAAGEAAGISKDKMRGYLKQLGLTPSQIRTLVKADTAEAENDVRRLQGFINGMHGKTVKVKVEGGTPGGQLIGSANGNILDYYANGGIRENHVAQIAPAGSMRVWAEPETGGEAYIPFAQSKRKRSQEIAMQTVSRLGGVASFANGGTTGSGSAPVIDDSALAAAVGSAVARETRKALHGTTFRIMPDWSVRAKEMGA